MSSEQTTPALYEKPMVYQLTNGDEMRLTINMVKQFLVRGNASLVTGQEIMFFMQICKARQLNPFINDCYLVKYGSDPAAIIVSVDYFRKNARRARDCKGWAAGIIVMTSDNVVRYSKGLVLPGEKLIGGWFRAQPEGWSEPFEHEVPLEAFIKRKRDGSVTQFWEPAKQPFMIRKVAECQGLRFLWGENTSGMYAPEEIVSDPADLEMKKIDTDRPKDMYAVTHKAPEQQNTGQQHGKEPATNGPDQSGDTANHDDHGDQGHSEPPGDKKTEATPETTSKQPQEAQDEAPITESLEMVGPENLGEIGAATDFHTWHKMRGGTPAKGTGLKAHVMANYDAFFRNWPTWSDDWKMELQRKWTQFYHEELPWLKPGGQPEDERPPEASDEGDADDIPPASELRPDGRPDEPSADDTSEFIDLLDKFNIAFTEAQKDPEGLMPIFKAAVNAANMKTGARPADAMQARVFLSSYENLVKSHREATNMSKDAVIEGDTPDEIWDKLYDFMHTNYPQVHFHLFKNFLAIRSAEAGVPVHELAKMVYTDDEHCRATMTKFKEWSGRTGNDDKF